MNHKADYNPGTFYQSVESDKYKTYFTRTRGLKFFEVFYDEDGDVCEVKFDLPLKPGQIRPANNYNIISIKEIHYLRFWRDVLNVVLEKYEPYKLGELKKFDKTKGG